MTTGLTIGWDYLTGYSRAMDTADRTEAEWPPHPGRVYMALAAAWFETADDSTAHEAQGRALQWLETLPQPQVILPAWRHVSRRAVPEVYVPVNDKAGPASAQLQSAPTLNRSKQARTFPAVWIGPSPCALYWPEASRQDLACHLPALERLCDHVTRIGHSASLVRMWAAAGRSHLEFLAADAAHDSPLEIWLPDPVFGEYPLRGIAPGLLNVLEEQYNLAGRVEAERLDGEIAALEAQLKTVRGRDAKAPIQIEIDDLKQRRRCVSTREPIRPRLGLWTNYRRETAPAADVARGAFDNEMVVLGLIDNGRDLPLASTLALTEALRGAVMRHGPQPPPAWVSGHAPNGQPLRGEGQHMAVVSLGFVGREHADGHILGLGLVFPRDVPRTQRAQALANLLLDQAGQVKAVDLHLGRLGTWQAVKRDWDETRLTLKTETWTAHPSGATTWGSVTPVVLDRFPKSDMHKDAAAWHHEVAELVALACQRVGLPRPVEVVCNTTSWHVGSPRAVGKRRPLRGQTAGDNHDATTALGDGFPPFVGPGGPRPQIHVRLRFDTPVVGPVLLGAGRFLGYGLCKPLGGRRPTSHA